MDAPCDYPLDDVDATATASEHADDSVDEESSVVLGQASPTPRLAAPLPPTPSYRSSDCGDGDECGTQASDTPLESNNTNNDDESSPSGTSAPEGHAEPRGWSVPYLQRVGPQPGGREAVEKHVMDNLTLVVNKNDPIIVTKTCDSKHIDYSVGGASHVLNGLKLHAIELLRDDSVVTQLESDVAEVEATVAELEQSVDAAAPDDNDDDDARDVMRELKAQRRRLTNARKRLDEEEKGWLEADPTEQTTLRDVVESMLPKITRDNLVFRPGGDALPDDFNLFTGYAVERLLVDYPDRYPEAARPMFHHIKDVLCAGDERVYDFVLKFFAHILKNPTDKCGVALLLYSKQGAGKNFLFTFLEAIIGSMFVTTVQDGPSLTGEFNAHRANRLLILANELKNGGVACKDANVLNSMITDKTDHLRCLGKDRQRIDSVSSLMMFTNEARAVRIGPDDRRYCAIECSNEKIGDKEYFANLASTIDDPKAQVEFFRQMREINVKGFHFGSNIPQTAYRDRLQREIHVQLRRDEPNTAREVCAYLAERVARGSKCTERELKFTAADLVERLREWMRTKGVDGADSLNVNAVSKQLNKLGFSATQTKIGGHNVRQYDLVSRAEIVGALRRQDVVVNVSVEDGAP